MSEEIIISFIVLLLFIFIIMPIIKENKLKENYDDTPQIINNSNSNITKLDKNICSKQCCKFDVWPAPFNTVNPNIDPAVLDNFIGTNLNCNYGPDGGGCLCVTKNDFNYIANHGQNIDSKYDNPEPSKEIKNVVDKAISMTKEK